MITGEGAMKNVQKFLDQPIWPANLKLNTRYKRQHDDTDGEDTGCLNIQFSIDGDAWVSINRRNMIRFRALTGGGQSPKTYAALLILAEAIRQDNENE